MKAFTALAILLPLLGSTYAAPPYPITDIGACEELDAIKYPGDWSTAITLTQDDNKLPSLHATNWLKAHGYTYTVSAGVDAASASTKGRLYAQVERSRGKGLGTLFLLMFSDKNNHLLKSYVLYPNESCHVDNLYAPGEIGSIYTSYYD